MKSGHDAIDHDHDIMYRTVTGLQNVPFPSVPQQAQMDSVDRLRLRGGFDAASVADGLAQEAAKLGKVAVTFE
eukprot:3786348-Rhodomonas_salina.3